MSSKKIGIGFIGVGGRGRGLLSTILNVDDVKVLAVSDIYPERIEKAIEVVKEKAGNTPDGYEDYHELLMRDDIDAVVIASTWITHIKIAVDVMLAGKHVSFEVGGAASEEECWSLIRTMQATGKCCMLLENVCYGDNELALFNMERQGVFGEIIHMQGGYEHDLRKEISSGKETKHGRLSNFIHRNGDLYPTHQLGPIAKLLRINRGNRFVSLTSMASKSRGLHDWISKNRESDYYLTDTVFEKGDIITTMIKCAHGETILLTHCTTLTRPYSRSGRVQGTNGIWLEDGNTIYIEGMSPKDNDEKSWDPHRWEDFDIYRKKYRHPLWKEYAESGIKTGHGGMDYLVLSSFVDSVKNNTHPPIDAYDAATWMAITYLSEQSVAMGSMPVPVPDFTNGKWIDREPAVKSKYALDEVYEDLFE